MRLGDVTHMTSKIQKPIKFILAGEGILKQGGKRFFKNAHQPKSMVVIKGAGHLFDEEGAEKKLFDETLKWFRKFSR